MFDSTLRSLPAHRRVGAFSRFVLAAAFLCANFLPTRAYANELTNGDFSAGLNGWTADGIASTDHAEGILGDGNLCGGSCSKLYQGAVLAAGSYDISLDFKNLLSSVVPQGSFPDTVFASLYFTGNLDAFDPESPATFVGGTAIFDIDHTGMTLAATGLTSSPSGKGAGWEHVTFNFVNPALQGVVILFELFGQNGTIESSFRIDNVSIKSPVSDIPEPASAALVGLGLAGALNRRRKRQS